MWLGELWHRAVCVAIVGVAFMCGAVGVSAQLPPGLTGTVVVVNKRANTVSFVDLASGRIVATAPTGNGPHELLVTGDGTTAVVSDFGRGSNSLTVIDVATGSVVRTIDLSPYASPHGLDFLPGDSLIAVTSEATGNVSIVRISDGTITSVISTDARGSHMVAVTGDGARMFTGDMSSNTVTELTTASAMKTRVFTTPATPEAINVTPDGARVFVGSNGEGLVSVIDTESGEISTLAGGFDWPYRIYPTPGVQQIIIPDNGNHDLRFFDGTTYVELGRIDFAGEGPQGLILHPDGKTLFLSLSRANRIAVIDIESREVVGYLPTGAGPDGIGYSSVVIRG